MTQKVIKGVLREQCECSRWVQPFRIVDTSTFPEEVTKGQRKACDVCWTGWIRHDPKHQRTINGRPFRMLDWLKLRGVPASNIVRQKISDAIRKAEMMSQRGEVERALDIVTEQNKGRAIKEPTDKHLSELARIDDIIYRRFG